MPKKTDEADVPPRAGRRALRNIPTTAAALAVRCGRFHNEAGYAQHDKAGHAFQSRWFGSMRGNNSVAVKEHLFGLDQLSAALREREARRPGAAVALRLKAEAIFIHRFLPRLPDGWPAFDTRRKQSQVVPPMHRILDPDERANDPCAVVL